MIMRTRKNRWRGSSNFFSADLRGCTRIFLRLIGQGGVALSVELRLWIGAGKMHRFFASLRMTTMIRVRKNYRKVCLIRKDY
jgi:hypothetical protein